jgi:hypothetical protein
MIARYPARYRVGHGEEATVIENDSKTLRMVVRGVEFTGAAFDDFEPSIAHDGLVLASFTIDRGSLCSYMLECDVPLPIMSGNEILDGSLHRRLELGKPRQDTRGGEIERSDS